MAGIVGCIWIGLCMAAFLSGAVFTLAGAPGWLPLPWSDFQDFVEGPDGRVYVGLAFYHRVLCYSGEGKFIASYRPPSGKHVHLAADARGQIYCLTSSGGDNLGVYDGNWRLVREYSERYQRDRVWRLQAGGNPALQPAPEEAQIADWPAKPGDILFANGDRRRSFACADGTTLIRRGNHLERLSADGQVITQYASPLLLRPLTFPWPAVTAWPLACLMGYIHIRKRQWACQLGVVRVGQKVLVDVLATLLLIAVVGSIWLGGLMVMINFNNSHTDEKWAGLLIVPIFVWFFFWPVAFGWGWKILQRRLGGPATLRTQRKGA
jgi:hypothetical protein